MELYRIQNIPMLREVSLIVRLAELGMPKELIEKALYRMRDNNWFPRHDFITLKLGNDVIRIDLKPKYIRDYPRRETKNGKKKKRP